MSAAQSTGAPQSHIAIEPFQRAAWQALCGPATHVLLYGGARSGKTVLWLLWLVLRALSAPRSTHLVLRLHFNHLKASVLDGSLPWVCERYWPGQKNLYRLNRTDWYADFSGGGRIYFGGLDDKERTEKILGQEHSSIVLNECSQISYAARSKAATRISQQAGLRNKVVYDENPPRAGHWTQRLFISKVDPAVGSPLTAPDRYASVRMNPRENPHLTREYMAELENASPRERERFLDGNFGAGTESPLWTVETIARARRAPLTPEEAQRKLRRIVIACDPSGCHGPEDDRSDEIGMIAEGIDEDGVVHILEDASGRYAPGGPEGWGAKNVALYHKWGADSIIGETNYGGAMVAAVVLATDPNVPFREVTASRAKHVRAEPVGALTDRDPPKLVFCGRFEKLEEQLEGFSTAGYTGPYSPDRADAMVWGAYALGVVKMPGQGFATWLAAQAAATRIPAAPVVPTEADLVLMRAPTQFANACPYCCQSGRNYYPEDGCIRADPRDVAILTAAGFTAVPST